MFKGVHDGERGGYGDGDEAPGWEIAIFSGVFHSILKKRKIEGWTKPGRKVRGGADYVVTSSSGIEFDLQASVASASAAWLPRKFISRRPEWLCTCSTLTEFHLGRH